MEKKPWAKSAQGVCSVVAHAWIHTNKICWLTVRCISELDAFALQSPPALSEGP